MAMTQTELTRRYIAKCRRIQVVLNPGSEKDKPILDYLNAHDTGKPDATMLKQMLLDYIALREAFDKLKA